MKSCSASAIFVLLRLSLLNFALSVVSPCTINGSNVFESDHQLQLKCMGGGPEKRWTLNDIRINTTTSSILTKDKSTLADSGVYTCYCSIDEVDGHQHHVLVFDAYLHASRIDGSCEVAILLMVTVQDKDRTHASVTSLQCPTLGEVVPRIYPFTSIANHREEHMIHMVAVGYSGESTHTFNFTINYQPNGVTYSERFSKTVTVDGKPSGCNDPISHACLMAHTTETVANRATQPQKYLTTASMFLAPLYQLAEWLL